MMLVIFCRPDNLYLLFVQRIFRLIVLAWRLRFLIYVNSSLASLHWNPRTDTRDMHTVVESCEQTQ
jgi:hypothetical protein